MRNLVGRRVWAWVRAGIMAWVSRRGFPAFWPGLPCMVYASFNSLAVRLSGYTVRRDDSGNLCVTLIWSAPEGTPIAVIGEDSAFPPDTVSLATTLIADWQGSGAQNNGSGDAPGSRRGDGSKLICAWCTPTRAGVIVTES
jgi:hypothetical protein